MTYDLQVAAQRRKATNDFDLHVGLIMKAEGVNKNQAKMIAWLEGTQGLNRRLFVGASANKVPETSGTMSDEAPIKNAPGK